MGRTTFETDSGLLPKRTNIILTTQAGYSVEGKQKGTLMIYEAFCQWAGVKPEPAAVSLARGNMLPDDRGSLAELFEGDRRVNEDDREMRRALAGPGNPAQAFDALRKNYRLRHDFGPVIV